MSRDTPADKLVEQAFWQYPHRFYRKARAAVEKLHGTT
jgi:hypothetical protein